MTTFTATMGSTKYIFIGTKGEWNKQVDKLLRTAKRTGEAIKFAHATIWYTKEPIADIRKAGSDVYIWAKDGNRVKCSVVKHTKTKDGRVEKELIGTCFADLD